MEEKHYPYLMPTPRQQRKLYSDNDMEEKELKACPFCGKQPQILPENPKTDGDGWTAICCGNDDCPTEELIVSDYDDGDYGTHREDAIKKWNTRPSIPKDGEANSGDVEGLIKDIHKLCITPVPNKFRNPDGVAFTVACGAERLIRAFLKSNPR